MVQLRRCTVVSFLQSSRPQEQGPSRLSTGKMQWRRLRSPTQSEQVLQGSQSIVLDPITPMITRHVKGDKRPLHGYIAKAE
jgi:hypothetical protein